jgi:two-component system OmpR family response regulator
MSDQPHRILVVDDEPNIVDVLAMALRYQGFEVDTAGTGETALAEAALHRARQAAATSVLTDLMGSVLHARLPATLLTRPPVS